MASVRSAINALLAVVKWPAALLALASLPALAVTLLWLASMLSNDFRTLEFFLVGSLAYWVLDALIFRHRHVGSWFSTLEHEVTHALFAWATFHRVVGMHVTYHDGGHVSFVGGGNWLIYIAPYWFPTLCIPIMLYAGLVSDPHPGWAAALGAMFMFHHLSTWRETHEGQTDLQKTGIVFAWMFLPAANLVSAGAIVSFAYGHTEFMLTFLARFSGTVIEQVSWAVHHVTQAGGL